MLRPRLIPILLLRGLGLYKSIKFSSHKYIGDPLNAVKIYNDLKADELTFLDINASRENRCIPVEFVKRVGEEANMPFSVGGGINSIEQIRDLVKAGAEKVIINNFAFRKPEFIKMASETFGSSTIVVCLDVKKKFLGKNQTWVLNGKEPTGFDPLEFSQMMEEYGAGELIIQSIENDGLMTGYDIGLLKRISEKLTIPIVALGGAGGLNDMLKTFTEANIYGLAAGSMFVYHGHRKGILINYPSKEEIFNKFLI